MCILILILATAFPNVSFGKPWESELPDVGQKDVPTFLIPNEEYPVTGRPIWEQAPPGGYYVAVGTERAYIGASLTPDCIGIIAVDRSPAVIRYHLINAALLRLATSRKNYLYLRQRAIHREWQEVADQKGASLSDRAILENPGNFLFWQTNVIKGGLPYFEHSADFWRRGIKAFYGANYLHIDDQFQRIKAMADADQIQAFQADLGDSQSVVALVRLFAKRGVRISVLDISNAWEEHYIRPDQMQNLLKAIEPQVVTTEAVFLITHGARLPFVPGHSDGDEHMIVKWGYAGFTFEYLNERLQSETFLEHAERVLSALPPDQGTYLFSLDVCASISAASEEI